MINVEKLKRLAELVETIVPYVTATIDVGGHFESETRPDRIG